MIPLPPAFSISFNSSPKYKLLGHHVDEKPQFRRRRERGGASLLSHLGGGGGGGSGGGGGDDSPPASARDTRPGPAAAAAARLHESVLLLLLRSPLRLLLPPLPPLPPLPCGVASRRARPPLPLQPLTDGRRLQPSRSRRRHHRCARSRNQLPPPPLRGRCGARLKGQLTRPPRSLTGWPAGSRAVGPAHLPRGALTHCPGRLPPLLLLVVRSAPHSGLRKASPCDRGGKGRTWPGESFAHAAPRPTAPGLGRGPAVEV
ncbi:hypothetical protein H8959_006618 [Pygathrix nigripes]